MKGARRNRGRPRRDDGPAIDLDALLDAAARSFATHGYEATSIRKLARDAGISHSLAHHYYDTKLDLWKACIDRGFGNMQTEMANTIQAAMGGSKMENSIEATIQNYVKLSERFSDYVLILLQEAGIGGERFDYITEKYFIGFTNLARSYYQQTIDAGKLRAIPWQTLSTMIIVGAPARFALQPLMAVLAKDEAATVDADQHAKDVADLLLHGMLPEQDRN